MAWQSPRLLKVSPSSALLFTNISHGWPCSCPLALGQLRNSQEDLEMQAYGGLDFWQTRCLAFLAGAERRASHADEHTRTHLTHSRTSATELLKKNIKPNIWSPMKVKAQESLSS